MLEIVIVTVPALESVALFAELVVPTA